MNHSLLLLLTVVLAGCGWGIIVVPPLPPQELASSMYVSEPALPNLSAGEQAPAPARVAQPPPLPQNRNTASEQVTRIVVSIPEQTLLAYAGDTVLRRITVSTAAGPTLSVGQDSENPHNHAGHFSVLRKSANHVSGQYGSPMPYAMFFYGGHAIHATEPHLYAKLGTPASHGCVRTNMEDAKWLFERTPLGTPVIVEGPITQSASKQKPARSNQGRADISRAN